MTWCDALIATPETPTEWARGTLHYIAPQPGSISLDDQIRNYLRDRPNTTSGIAVAFSIGYASADRRVKAMEQAGKIVKIDSLWRVI